jgi:hypothetical protein
LLEVDGFSLIAQLPGAPSCRLHAEGKVLNGNAQKADLLICDPLRRQRFNYEVDYVIELKQSLTDLIITEEVEKLRSYRRSFHGCFLATDRIARLPAAVPSVGGQEVQIFHRRNVAEIRGDDFPASASGAFETSLTSVRTALDETLARYGAGKEQYHSFFWCNYEHEEWRRHSFPAEGDFNAHFYHRLRQRLPAGVEIRSEMHPPGDPRRRIDLVVRDKKGSWAIPIDVKMNWDQFKPKFKAGVSQTPEAEVILGRLDAIRQSFAVSQPMIVVIQGAWQLPRDIRSQAMPVLESAHFPLEFVAFDELKNRIDRRAIGRK